MEILESESNKENEEDKHNRVDILVKDQNGDLIIIEVQIGEVLSDRASAAASITMEARMMAEEMTQSVREEAEKIVREAEKEAQQKEKEADRRIQNAIQNMTQNATLSDEQIAQILDVTVAEVQQVRNSSKK